jgi:hypothetical protein
MAFTSIDAADVPALGSIAVAYIEPARVGSVWSDCAHGIGQALVEYMPGALTVDDCRFLCERGQNQLWIASQHDRVVGAAISEVVLQPQGYPVAGAAYYNGEEFAFYVDKTCGATPSLNINGLGAANLRKFSGGAWSTLSAGDIVANQPLRVAYNSGATTFDIVAAPPTTVWQALDSQLLSGSAAYIKQSIPTTINHLQILFDLTFATNAVNLQMQFYNSGGTLDAGSSSYSFSFQELFSGTTAVVGTSTGATISMTGPASNSSTIGAAGTIDILNIQGVKSTQSNFRLNYLSQDGATICGVTGFGYRVANGNITGVKIFVNSGNISGKVTLLASSN